MKKTDNVIRFDWAAKNILRDKASFVILEGFLSALLGEKVSIMELLESESNRQRRTAKANRVDVKAKNGKASEKDVDFKVDWLDSDFSDNDYSFNGSAENYAKIYPIEDEMLMDGANDVQYVLLTNSLKSKGRVDQMIDGQKPGTNFDVVGGYLLFETPVGNKLYTTDGKEIGDIPEIKQAFSVNRANTQRMLFIVEEVLLP